MGRTLASSQRTCAHTSLWETPAVSEAESSPVSLRVETNCHEPALTICVWLTLRYKVQVCSAVAHFMCGAAVVL